MKKNLLMLMILLATVSANAQKSKKKNTRSNMIEMQTTAGRLVIELYDQTPQHRDNFIKLAESGYYDSLLFHRVINQFMIQGGDPDSKNAPKGKQLGQGGPGYTVPAEFVDSLLHVKGALAAARTGDMVNPTKASSGSQFYIVQGRVFSDSELNNFEMRSGRKYSEAQRELYKTVGGTPHLDGAYTVYGRVVEGLDVIDKIASSPTAPGDRPVEDVRILSVKVLK
jgi:cyclophilin family peptidyl-prolyl cis-trans isomerase